MKAWIRWGKFNLVGAMGMGVQLAALALLNRAMAGHLVFASSAAVEITLLHNFAWHWHYTWRDRRAGVSRLGALGRFHLSNGLVSMLGNFVLMQLLVDRVHIPVLPSNCASILCCSLVNFFLGNHWAFTQTIPSESLPKPKVDASTSVCSLRLALTFLLFIPTAANAQTTASQQAPDLPNAPTPAAPQTSPVPKPTTPADHGNPSASYLYNVGVFCGAGAGTSTRTNIPTTGCGAGFTFVPTLVFVEVGMMAPQANRSYLSGYISLDGSIPLARTTMKYLPLAIVGYSRLFETGHSLDYGLALALPRSKKHSDYGKSLRIELRDYCTFANPTQHNVMIRVGWMEEMAD
jgi:putative flippase GtrA